ncbi:MAG: CotH kinase family protein [Lachnospiraceae bacterium]|nr:CotH kinase family protein [Lachnospiraceae bacterium]
MFSKAFKRIISVTMIFSMIVTITACSDKEEKSSKKSTKNSKNVQPCDYEQSLFDTSKVHNIDITLSDDDWSDLKANPLNKTKYEADITIDGETVNKVSFSTKGNTSLSFVASSDSDRYSFKVNFGKYVEGQTYQGLNKLNLNNIYADATYMKDYICYQIFREASVNAPLVSYVWLTVNGNEQGLYIAVEDISESYLNRTEDGEGELYKPETDNLANMNEKKNTNNKDNNGNNNDNNRGDFNPGNMPQGGFQPGNMPEMPEGGFQPGNMPEMPEGFDPGNMPERPEGDFDPGEMPNMPGGGFGGNANGADLAYSDDKIESYSDIFENAVTDVTDEDNSQVIAALKGLSEGKNLEDYIDVDEVISYFVAHNFVLNYDSYTGNMLHNYFLYLNDGKLSMLPWDYNLSFGGFEANSDTTSLVNTGIDTPLSGSSEESRPMWQWISSNEEYLNKYHEVYNKLITDYFESGRFTEEIEAVYNMIKPYVEKDSTAFYSADEFEKAYDTLKNIISLRASSIRKQLNNELSTKTDEQDSSQKVDVSAYKASDMGTHGGGKGQDFKKN